MRNCEQCGGELKGSEKFCPACGNSMEQVGEFSESNAPEKKPVRTKKLLIVFLMLSLAGASIFLANRHYRLNAQYRQAMILFDDMKYDEAKVAFAELGNHKDASERHDECVKEIEAESQRIQEEKKRIAEEKRQRAEEEKRLAEAAREESVRREQYAKDFAVAAYTLVANYDLCSALSYEITKTWHSAIFDSKQDFNTELNNLLTEWKQPDGYIDSAIKGKALVDERMGKLSNPPIGLGESYEHLLKKYKVYTQMYTQIVSPNGSYESYRDETNKWDTEFASLTEQWNIVNPAVLDVIAIQNQSIE